MGKDVIYTNGVIAAREKYLLKEKLLRLCEGKAEDAFRILLESGYGSGAEAEGAYDYEALIGAEERALDDFIREYAPSEAEAAYLLAPRDFHNAKALLKAEYLHADAEKMLAPEGRISVSELQLRIKNGEFSALGKELGDAVKEAAGLLSAEGASGAEVGVAFEKAAFAYLFEVCKKNPVLKKLLSARADMSNILTAFRSDDESNAKKAYVTGGRLTEKQLEKLFDADLERAAHALDKTPYATFCEICAQAKQAGRPLTEAEKLRDSYETDFFAERKYELEKNQPFLYYVFRRRAESENVRIIFVCLLAGMRESEIKSGFGRFEGGGMTGKMAIVGDGDSIMVFKAAGVATFPAENEKKARDTLRRIAKEYQIIFLTEELARPLSEFLKRFDEEPYPVVLSIPSKNGSSGHGEELLKSAMERALGVDILFNRE